MFKRVWGEVVASYPVVVGNKLSLREFQVVGGEKVRGVFNQSLEALVMGGTDTPFGSVKVGGRVVVHRRVFGPSWGELLERAAYSLATLMSSLVFNLTNSKHSILFTEVVWDSPEKLKQRFSPFFEVSVEPESLTLSKQKFLKVGRAHILLETVGHVMISNGGIQGGVSKRSVVTASARVHSRLSKI